MSISQKRTKQTPLWFKLFLLTAMYLCQAIPLGYIFGSLPVILREQSVDLKAIGGIFALHLPWACKFLYASFVDRRYVPSIGRRKSWILPLQWLGALLLVVISYFPPDFDFSVLYVLLLLLSFIMATNDIAVDGYATDILQPAERAWGNTIQSGARFAGLMLGGGVMLFMNVHFGWQSLCLFLGVVVVLLSVPVLLHKEIPHIDSCTVSQSLNENTIQKDGGVVAFVKRREVLWVLPVLIAPTAFAFTAIQMRAPLLIDLGLQSTQIGKILTHFAYPAGLTGTFICGWFLHKVGVKPFLRFFSSIVIVLAAYTVFIALKGHTDYWQAAVVLSVDNILVGAVMVWSYTLMMKVSSGKNAGTGFAVLSSLFIILPMATAPLFGAVGDKFGMVNLYILLCALSCAGLFVAEMSLHIQNRERCVPQCVDKECAFGKIKIG